MSFDSADSGYDNNFHTVSLQISPPISETDIKQPMSVDSRGDEDVFTGNNEANNQFINGICLPPNLQPYLPNQLQLHYPTTSVAHNMNNRPLISSRQMNQNQQNGQAVIHPGNRPVNGNGQSCQQNWKKRITLGQVPIPKQDVTIQMQNRVTDTDLIPCACRQLAATNQSTECGVKDVKKKPPGCCGRRPTHCFVVTFCVSSQVALATVMCCVLFYYKLAPIEQMQLQLQVNATNRPYARMGRQTSMDVNHKEYAQFALGREAVSIENEQFLQCDIKYRYNRKSKSLICNKSHLSINTSGTYFIYVEIFLHGKKEVNASSFGVSLSRVLSNPSSNSREQYLAKTVLSPQKTGTSTQAYAAYMGAITMLQRGDKIEMKLTQSLPEGANIQPQFSYIGLLKM